MFGLLIIRLDDRLFVLLSIWPGGSIDARLFLRVFLWLLVVLVGFGCQILFLVKIQSVYVILDLLAV